MSYFGTTLKEMLDRKEMKAVRLAEISGVSQPTISRYIRGDQGWVSTEDFSLIAHAISNDPQDHAKLLCARLLDERQGPGSDLVRIDISGTRLNEPMASYGVKLPAELEADFAVIREWVIRDRDVREIIEGLGALLSRGPKSRDSTSSGSHEADLVKLAKSSYRKRSARPGAPPKESQ